MSGVSILRLKNHIFGEQNDRSENRSYIKKVVAHLNIAVKPCENNKAILRIHQLIRQNNFIIIPSLKFVLKAENRQHEPLMDLVLLLFFVIPKIRRDIFAVIRVPDTEVEDQVRIFEMKTPVEAQVQRVINRVTCIVYLCLV